MLGILAVVAGLVLVVLGVVNEAVWLGAIGFALMVGGAAYAVTPPRTPEPTLGAVGHDGTVRAHAPAKGTGARSSRKAARADEAAPERRPAGFMQRLEERWDKRRGDGFR